MNSNENIPLPKKDESAAVKTFLSGETEKLTSSAKERVDFFLSTLDFSTARFFQKDESEKIYFVPPGQNSSLKQALIIFCNEDGTYRRASRLRYSLNEVKNIPDFSNKDFYFLFSNSKECKKEIFTISTLEDIFLQRITVNQKGDFGYGFLKKKDSQPQNQIQAENDCIDWYMVTTITYADGSTETTEEFLFTTCNGCPMNGQLESLCEAGNNWGASNPPSEEPVTKQVDWRVGNSSSWYVKSYEKLNGTKITNGSFGGGFTKITHLNSAIFNLQGLATWQELAVTTSCNPTYAYSTVSGRVTKEGVPDMEVNKSTVWGFYAEF